MKKLLVLSLLFMGCDIEIADHTHDYTYEHTHDDVVHTHDFSEVNHTHDSDDSSYELLAWVFAHNNWACFRIGEYECGVTESSPYETVDVQEIRIYNGERYNVTDTQYFIVEITDVDGVVKVYDKAWVFGYLEE